MPCWRPAGPSAEELGIEVRPPRKSTDDAGRPEARLWKRLPGPRGFMSGRSRCPTTGRSDQAESPCWPSSPTRTAGPWPCSPRPAGAGSASSRYDLYDPLTDRRQPVYESWQASSRADRLDVLPRPSPITRSGFPDLLRFSLPGVRREVRLVLVLAILGGLLGLAVPIGSGILVDQVIPEVDLPGDRARPRFLIFCLFLAALAVSTRSSRSSRD